MANPLDPVLEWYFAANDSLRITRRVLTLNISGVVTDKHVFFTKTVAEGVALIETATEELNRLTILGLTAVFERTLRDRLVVVPRGLFVGDPLRDSMREVVVRDIEFWNLSSQVVDVYPGVDATVRGKAKQIIDYRNWVAHGNTIFMPAPYNFIPEAVYRDLTAFLLQAGVIGP